MRLSHSYALLAGPSGCCVSSKVTRLQLYPRFFNLAVMSKRVSIAGLAITFSNLVSSAGVGDYIASGLDISQSPAAKDADASTANNGGETDELSTTRSLIKWHTSSVGNSSTSVVSATTPPTSTAPTASTPPPLTTSLSAGSAPNNVSVDECWSSWEAFWSNNLTRTESSTSTIGFFTSTSTYTETAYPGTTEAHTSTIKTTDTIDNGGFAISTQTLDTTSTTKITIFSRPASTETNTLTGTSLTLLPYTGTILSEPTCKLPSSVSQCQAQWEAYVTSQLVPGPSIPPHCDINYGVMPPITTGLPSCVTSYRSAAGSYQESMDSITRPPCSQASIGGDMCNTIKDAYVYQQNYVFWPSRANQYAPFFSNGYLGTFENLTATDYNTSWYWPTSSTLGVPSCTLGCGRCAVTGGTVQLLYWPATATNNLSATGPVTLSTDGTVLTSPTYYISYRSVYASDGCSGVGPTHYNTIVPIPASETLSSVFGGTVPCDAHFRYTQEWLATASFNVTDMNEPVPFSIYSSQPWCATYQREHGCQSSCPTGLPYKPLLVVPHDVLRSMDPAWASCYGDLRGQYDPPSALHGVGSIAGPTVTAPGTIVSQTASATPASSPSDPAAKPTTATAEPDSVPTTVQSGAGAGPSTDPEASTGSSQYTSEPPASTDSPPTTVQSGAGADPSTYAQGRPDSSQSTIEPPTSTAQQAAPASQDVAGAIASLIGGQSSRTASAYKATPASSLVPGTTQGVAGIIASLLGGQSDLNTKPQQSVEQDSNTGSPTPPRPTEEHTQTIVVGSQTLVVAVPTGQGSAVTVAGSQETLTLNPGGAAGTVGGQAISGPATGGLVVAQGDTTTIVDLRPTDAPGGVTTPGDPAVSSGDPGATDAASPPANVVGDPASGTSNLQTGSQTSAALAAGSSRQSSIAEAAVTMITIASVVYTAVAASSGAVVLANSGTTVTVPTGSAVPLNGQTISVGDAGQLPDVVAGSSTYTLSGVRTVDGAGSMTGTHSNSRSDAAQTSTSRGNSAPSSYGSASATLATAGVARGRALGTGMLGLALLVALFMM